MKTNDTLDLDSPADWHRDFCSLVDNSGIRHAIMLELGKGGLAAQNFLEQVTCSDAHLRNLLAERLRDDAEMILRNRYSCIIAYHGCRPSEHSSYRTDGILPADTQALIAQAKSLFAGLSGFEEAVKDIGYSYINYNHDKVGLLRSATWAKHHRNDHAKGSEFIRAIANRLGPEAKMRSRRTGRPILIKCAIPINWFVDEDTHTVPVGYAKDVIAHLIRMRHLSDMAFNGFMGGFLLTRSIPLSRMSLSL